MSRVTKENLIATVIRIPVATLNRMDKTRSRIRTHAKRTPPKSEMVRGILEAVFASPIDFTECTDAADFRHAVASVIGKGGR